MITAIWKVKVKDGQRDAFTDSYELFKKADGFINCQFYNVNGEDNALLAVETWESEDKHKDFMSKLSPEEMGSLFGKLDGQPEVYHCEVGKNIVK